MSLLRLTRFSLVGLAGAGVQLVTLSALVNGLGAHYAAATVASVVAAILHNFLWHQRWTWRDRPARGPAWLAFLQFLTANGAVSIAGNLVVMAVLVGVAGLPAVVANAIAIAACGGVNFLIADGYVFGR